MFRLTVILAVGLFLGLRILGQDNGQVRQGLIAAASEPEAAAVTEVAALNPTADPASLTEMAEDAVFLPAQPVVIAATEPAPAIEEPVVEAVVVEAPAEPEPALMYVSADSVNVRGGPSTDFDVVERLNRGESVLVVAEADAVEGWARIRIEGDGIEGYIATRLLTGLDPDAN